MNTGTNLMWLATINHLCWLRTSWALDALRLRRSSPRQLNDSADRTPLAKRSPLPGQSPLEDLEEDS